MLLVRPGETRTQGGNARVRDGRDACPATRKRNRRHDGNPAFGGDPVQCGVLTAKTPGQKDPEKQFTKSLPQSSCVPPIFCEVHEEERKIEPSKIMSKDKYCAKPGRFGWNELVTPDVAAAKKFYTGLLGWKTQPFGKGVDYTLFKKGRDTAGGLMKCPKPGNPAQWIPYVFVDNVDATAKKTARLGGEVVMEPFDVPDVGRIAVLVDPQGAAIGIFKPAM